MVIIRRVALLAVVTNAFAMHGSAQSSLLQSSPPPDQTTTISVSGCVSRTAAPAAESAYLLTEARNEESTAAEPTPDAVHLTSTVATYRLSGNDEEIAQHIDRRVTISGTVDQRDPAAAGANHGTANTTTPPKLTVTSMKETTGSCSR
jgi:hypothetical protein